MAFVLACRKNAVPVIEVQHGVQGEMHPAYAAWPSPQDGNAHMLLPDFFWVWSEWEASVIGRWASGTSHHTIIGGNPWNEIWSDGSRWGGVGEALLSARTLKDRSKGKPIVLVTLQYGFAPEQQLLPLAQLMRLASSEMAFWVRLHPSMHMRRAEIRELLASSGEFELDYATDIPLPALLQYADVHLTHSSSSVIEAAQAGVPSVLTATYGAEIFYPLLESGVARLETGNAQAVASALINMAAQRHSRRSNVYGSNEQLKKCFQFIYSTNQSNN
ncbi:hypothetical protein [Altererythrobacter rubellus]|uniref:Uncharacterized protein n=1 Tax=Altererythrobacter rubellus TaxID=2173831 RepID=A0A9Y2B390_9SPHN|nr:hypothetical protein [Altererythrobacter rubellus]WIW95942.1 hypothetical protein QQX03_02210 [Altererythrobacter rubellus]